MKKTLVLDDEHHVKGVVLECKATEYMVIDRALSLLAVNQNVPLADRVKAIWIVTRIFDTQIKKEEDNE